MVTGRLLHAHEVATGNVWSPTGLILWTLGPFNVFVLLIGWICLHGVLD